WAGNVTSIGGGGGTVAVAAGGSASVTVVGMGGRVGTAVGVASLPWFYALTQRDQPFWRRLSWLLPLVGVLATAVAFVLFWPSLQAIWNDPNVDTAVGNLNTLAFRKIVWTWGLTAVGDFPFTGTGLGSFRAVAPRLYPLPIFTDISHAHNMLLQIALDMGLPGLAIYLALVGLMAYMSWRIACTRHPLFRPLSIGLLANLVALHTYGLLDTLALGSKTGIFLWLTLGLFTAVFGQTHHQDRN
ncbi:MAG: O-antigen ligase family protein, partial [Anaerolineales bacterium]|nr:O-antigen ligase family protein [Anaerolineales bacterium]